MSVNNTLIHEIIWGLKTNISSDVFQRWCQGFEFSEFESTALVQYNGGPCSILASVQAHIFYTIYFDSKCNNLDPNCLLTTALTDILKLVSPNNTFIVAFIEEELKEDLSFDNFNSILRFTELITVDELEATVLSIQSTLNNKYGVLCYLYSIIATHGVEQLKSEISDETNCLIDHFHGHSSQCLTNLLITGKATPYLFDNEKDLGGYVLRGIMSQPKIGFLTIMEYLRYCEVGWNFKNPQLPIWILASETHLTVLCSRDSNIIEQIDNPLALAEKIFNRIDSTDNGFIMPDVLHTLLEQLNLATDENNMARIINEVDPEKLGILLKVNLLRCLYPEESKAQQSKADSSYKFPVIHYNGLIGSNFNREVRYTNGEACVDDFSSQTKDYSASDCSILKCLRTKWPTISLKWDNLPLDYNPSLN